MDRETKIDLTLNIILGEIDASCDFHITSWCKSVYVGVSRF